jgi:hypothetical protein
VYVQGKFYGSGYVDIFLWAHIPPDTEGGHPLHRKPWYTGT